MKTITRTAPLARAFTSLITLGLAGLALQTAHAQSPCQSGAAYAANAYIRFNPLYEVYFGDLKSYITANGAHFRAGSDAVKCLSALSDAYRQHSHQLYDPADVARKVEIDRDLARHGISSGAPQPSASSLAYGMSTQLAQLARGLPSAANGNFGPLVIPTNKQERTQYLARQLFPLITQNPTVREVFAALEPLIREAAELEYKMIMQTATSIASN